MDLGRNKSTELNAYESHFFGTTRYYLNGSLMRTPCDIRCDSKEGICLNFHQSPNGDFILISERCQHDPKRIVA